MSPNKDVGGTKNRMMRNKEIIGRLVRFGGEEHRGWLPAGVPKPKPTPVDDVLLNLGIQATDGGVILEWWDEAKKHIGDTWHQSLQDAIAQAEANFGIKPDEWKDEDPQPEDPGYRH
jgi:hypothetical protein